MSRRGGFAGWLAAWLPACLLWAGCALTSRSAPLELRYFAPPSHAPSAPVPAAASAPALRLGRVTPGALLRDNIVHRDSAVELTPYETLRWTDPPETYVRRALVRALFDSGEFAQALGDAPALDVDILAFEEVRRGHRRFGALLAYRVRDDQRVIAHGTVAIEREVPPAEAIEGVVAAIGGALDAATAELARRLRPG